MNTIAGERGKCWGRWWDGVVWLRGNGIVKADPTEEVGSRAWRKAVPDRGNSVHSFNGA